MLKNTPCVFLTKQEKGVYELIQQKCFWHGWKYDYALHRDKSGPLLSKEFAPLHNYLDSLFSKCPDDYFKQGPRGSKLKFPMHNLDIRRHNDHEVSLLCSYGLDINAERFKSEHMKVQMFMLENDLKTIAMEIPIWLYPSEINGFESIFNSNEALTGHIDLLKVEDGLIWIWDYKPNAQKEEFASTQTYFYALMLSKRANIPLEKIRCGYFDETFTYVFKPDETFLKELTNAKDLMDF